MARTFGLWLGRWGFHIIMTGALVGTMLRWVPIGAWWVWGQVGFYLAYVTSRIYHLRLRVFDLCGDPEAREVKR